MPFILYTDTAKRNPSSHNFAWENKTKKTPAILKHVSLLKLSRKKKRGLKYIQLYYGSKRSIYA